MNVSTRYNGPHPIVDAMMFRITDIAPADYICSLVTRHGLRILSINSTGVIIGYYKNTESEQHAIAVKNEILERHGCHSGNCDNGSLLKRVFGKFRLRG